MNKQESTKQDEKFVPIEWDKEQYDKVNGRPEYLNTTRQNG